MLTMLSFKCYDSR